LLRALRKWLETLMYDRRSLVGTLNARTHVEAGTSAVSERPISAFSLASWAPFPFQKSVGCLDVVMTPTCSDRSRKSRHGLGRKPRRIPEKMSHDLCVPQNFGAKNAKTHLLKTGAAAANVRNIKCSFFLLAQAGRRAPMHTRSRHISRHPQGATKEAKRILL